MRPVGVISGYYPVHGPGRQAIGQGLRAGDHCATLARYPVHRAGHPVTGAAGRNVSAIRGGAVTLSAAADEFLSAPRMSNPNTRRAYAGAIDRTIAVLGPGRLLTDVSDDEVGAAAVQLWGGRAEATWNRNRAAIGSWLTWCQTRKRWPAPSVPADCERRREHPGQARAVPKAAIERLLTRRDIPLREKTLWRMLYETAARTSEILALNVEDLDLENRRAPIRSKGGAREEVWWGTGTARLLPRLLRLPDGTSRASGPCSCPGANPSPPGGPDRVTSARTPAGPGSATTGAAPCSATTRSPPAAAGNSTSSATAPRLISATRKSRCSSSWPRPGTSRPAPPCATSGPAARPSPRSLNSSTRSEGGENEGRLGASVAKIIGQ